MTGACLSCDRSRRLDISGLCQPCRYGLRFITNPAQHRAAELQQIHAAIARPANGGPTPQAALGDDTWSCHLCNQPILGIGPVTLIPTAHGNALCLTCVTATGYWPLGWTHPTPRPCLCRACRLPVLDTAARR